MPVNPEATPEAQDLLKFLYSLSGRRTMTGQHNTPREMSEYSDQAARITGQYPAVWGQDFGFAADGDMDGTNFRQGIVEEAMRQHAAGSVITLMWHAVRPTEEEPVTFNGSICDGKLGNEDWQDMLTPGTETHARWMRQVDVIAGLLANLRDAGVPILWRPYHELNGAWFWWGARGGENGYVALYKQMYHRFVHIHHLSNLVWVWNASAPSETILPYADCYPGHDFVDVLAVDIYASEFHTESYASLAALAEGRPIALGEVGHAPTPALLDTQPLWTWFMVWTNFLTNENKPESLRSLFGNPRILNRPAFEAK